MLYSVGFSGKFIRILKSLYDNAFTCIKTSDGTPPLIKITQGILQDKVLSPNLFSVRLADLEKFLVDNSCRGISINHYTELNVLAYSDDIVLPADSKIELRRYCNLIQLDLNVVKTKIIMFSKGNISKDDYSFEFDGVPIEIVDNFSYLRVELSRTCVYRKMANKVINEAYSDIGSSLFLLSKLKTSSWSVINEIYSSLFFSKLTYGTLIWANKYIGDLDKVHLKFYKRVLHLTVNTSSYALRNEISHADISFYILKSIVS